MKKMGAQKTRMRDGDIYMLVRDKDASRSENVNYYGKLRED